MNKITSCTSTPDSRGCPSPHSALGIDVAGETRASSSGSFSQLGLANLMERYVDGDQDAFDALHRALTPNIRRQIGGKISDRSAVEDLLQTTFLKAHLARDRFCADVQDNQDRAVATWYSAIARNATTDYLRKLARSRLNFIASDDEPWYDKEPDPTPNIEELGIMAQERTRLLDWLKQAIALLPRAQREVIEMHRLAELSMAEVAQRQGAKIGTVRVRAHRAYSALASAAKERNLRGPDSAVH